MVKRREVRGLWWAVPAVVVGALIVAPGAALGAESCMGRRATLVGTAGDDTLIGTAGTDVVVALDGDDTVRTLQGRDFVCAGRGSDVVRAGAGSDRVLGGPSDEDNLFGNRGADLLDGGPGAFDRVTGGPGDDLLRGGRGDGDHALYEESSKDIHADLAAGVITGVGRDRLVSIEAVHGGSGDDVLLGDGEPNDLFGLGGRDLIRGRGNDDFFLAGGGGADRVFGGPGNDDLQGHGGPDELSGGPGDGDFIQPGFGDDDVHGGGGFDFVVYTFTTFPEVAPAVHVDLAAGFATGQGRDRIAGIEEVWGTDDDDTLLGDGEGNGLLGFDGEDSLKGRGSQDFLLPGGGDDAVDGGSNPTDEPDMAIFDFAISVDEFDPESPIAVDLQAGTAVGHGVDSLTSVEAALGTPFDDSLAGDDVFNLLVGLAGSDVIEGRAGDDILDGDLHYFEGVSLPGTDSLDGGPAHDLCLGGEITVNCERFSASAAALRTAAGTVAPRRHVVEGILEAHEERDER